MRIGINLLPVPYQLDGVGVYAYHLVRALVRLTDDEYVLFVNKDCADHFRLDNPRVELVVCPVGWSSRARRTLWEQLFLPIQVWCAGVDILHSLSTISPLLAPVSKVLTLHDLTFLHVHHKFSATRTFYYKVLGWLSARQAKIVLTVSRNSKEDIVQSYHVDPGRVVVTYSGVPHRGAPKPERVEQVLERFGLTRGRFFLFVSRIEPGKNILGLLRGYARLIDRADARVPLVLVGRPTRYQSTIDTWIRTHGLTSVVHFVGYIDNEELLAFYNGALAFVFPSLYEGFGSPVVEAMACGLPVITSDRSSLPEIAGDAALLVDPEDSDALCAAMYKVLTSPELRDRMRTQGFRQVAKFTWTAVAQRTREAYSDACKSSPEHREQPRHSHKEESTLQ